MNKIKEMRVSYNNDWPEKKLFPVEELLNLNLKRNNIQQIFIPAKLGYCSEQYFHTLLSHYLDGIDQLPLRPDIAFDSIWKALDHEFFKIQEESILTKNISRFDAFIDKINGNNNINNTFESLSKVIPMQTCEFVAKRIFTSKITPDNHADAFLKRVRNCIGINLYNDFLSKYESLWLISPSETQRKSAGLLRKLMLGEIITLDGNNYQFTNEQCSRFLISIVMPQYRNERFHGTTVPPFRSSSAKLKTYAHAYYLFFVAYGLLLEVFLYRSFDVITQDLVTKIMIENKNNFIKVFGNTIKK